MRLLPPSLLLLLSVVAANPVSLPFTDCFEGADVDGQKLVVTSVFAQAFADHNHDSFLNLTVFGTTPKPLLGLSNDSLSLSTLFTSTSVLTLSAWSNSSYLCTHMRPPSPLPPEPAEDSTFCPIQPGPFAFSSSIPWGDNRELTTLITRLRAVDPFAKELLCIDLLTTPLAPRKSSSYGQAEIILWSSVALTLAYWVVVGLARIASAWNRGITRPGRGLWSRFQSAGYILASAISGERLATSPALMRFCTPSMRDVIFHTQWCAILAMVGVEWPEFIYPLLSQTAWATLAFNVTLIGSSENRHWDPLNATSFTPPEGYADQISDPTSPLFIDQSYPNTLFTLPPDSRHGIAKFAYTLGLRPQDLFPTCLILFLSIAAATIALSVLLWLFDYTITIAGNHIGGQGHQINANQTRLHRTRSPIIADKDKDMETGTLAVADEAKSLTGSTQPTSGRRFPNPRFSLPLPGSGASSERGIGSHRAWWRLRSDIGAFHGSVLHGNLVRLLILFHLPITIFSCYQMTSPREVVGETAVALSALSFVILSILIPLHLVIRVTFTTTNKLYDETKTLLSLGPLYNHHRHGSQLFACLFFCTNITFGVTIGAGQKSGTAQAIIILVVEVVSALVTSIWLPWGSGASMGLISFLFCVARIVVAVLLVILTQAISIGPGPDGWVAYGILIILALVYLALLLMLLVKIFEGLLRIFGGIGFDRSKRVIDSGILGVLYLMGLIGRRHGRHHHRRRSHRHHNNSSRPTQHARSDSDLSSYNPPAGGIPVHVDGTSTPPRFLTTGSRKGSTYSQTQPPASVLKPEHANRPYKEDSDDEGYIMGPFQPSPIKQGHTLVPSTASGTTAGYAPFVADAVQTMPPLSIVGSTSGGASSSYHQPSSSGHQKASSSGHGSGHGSSGGTVGGPSSSSGFSRVGGGRAHIDAPYAITGGGASGGSGGSTQTFPSSFAQTSQTHVNLGGPPSATSFSPPVSAASASGAGGLPPPSAYTFQPQAAQPQYYDPRALDAVNADDDAPLPLSVSAVERTIPVGTNGLPRGAMQPAHIRTKSQTAIVENYLPSSGGGTESLLGGGSQGGSVPPSSASMARFAAQQQQQMQGQQEGVMGLVSQGSSSSMKRPIANAGANNTKHYSQDTFLRAPDTAPPFGNAKFIVGGDEKDDESGGEEQESGKNNANSNASGSGSGGKKKPWYALRRNRPHSSEGRTSTSTSTSDVAAGFGHGHGASASASGGVDEELGGIGAAAGTSTPQRSFVVIRKPPGSFGRNQGLNAMGAGGGAGSSSSGSGYPKASSRPPTR